MKKRFNKIHIEITSICNLQCSFCPPLARAKAVMDLNLFENLIRQIAPLTELVCLHLMGEPLIHPKLAQMVDICDRYDCNIFLVTNGVLLKPEKYPLLLHPRFYQINFSLHSFFDNFPERDESTYLQHIFDFTDLALKQRPELYVNFRLWNLQEVKGELSANRRMLSQVCQHYDFALPAQINLLQKKSIRVKERLYLHFDTEFVWPDLAFPILGKSGTCYGLNSHFGVLVDGTLVPCCLDKEGVIALGDTKETPIQEILNSPRAKNILEGFRQRKLVENLCQKCQYIERFGS